MKVLLFFTMFSYILMPEATGQSQNKPYWTTQSSGVKTSIRGASAVSENVCWLGTMGKILRTLDGGETWETLLIPGADSLEFRDLEAIDENICVAMSSGTGSDSRIYKTSDGGKTWATVKENQHPQGFYNGMAFWDDKIGLLAGDPVAGVPYLLKTVDGGESWLEISAGKIPLFKEGEFGFAASGTHIVTQGDSSVYFGTGGSVARIFYSKDQGNTWAVVNTPMIAGEASQGIFSVDFKDSDFGIAVGGDYSKETEGIDNVILSRNGGKTWQLSESAKLDYRSCIKFGEDFIIVTGPSGTNISYDAGVSFEKIGEKGFHTLGLSHDGKTVWAAGAGGLVAKLQLK